jgi:D-sedoheptulose 7-phosphate isomerase
MLLHRAFATVCVNQATALDESKERGLTILGIVGRDGGYANKVGHIVIVMPTVDADRITPHSESFQAVSLAWIGLSPDTDYASE